MTTTTATSGTTSTTAVTTSSSTTPSTSSAAQSILTSLNAGSGIDIASLVDSLTQAQFAAQTSQLQSKSDALDAQISDVGTLLSNIQSFSTALNTLVTGGTLQSSPTVSNGAIVSATALAGARLAGLSASVEVRQLATAQSAASAVLDPAATIGGGTLTLTIGSVVTNGDGTTGFSASGDAIPITIDPANATLGGIAAQINSAAKAAGAGVTASVVNDGTGARLVLRGATGAAQAFQLQATSDPGGGLSQFDVDPAGTSSMTMGAVAQDAIVSLDGVQFHRASNQINDLVPGVKLNLLSAQPGTVVSIGSTTPTDALSQAVSDFVDTYNQFHAIIAADLNAQKGGTLSNDLAVKTLNTQLSQLTLASLITNPEPGAPNTLATIGVGTNNDGTLKIDPTQLAKTIAAHPEAIEAMFTQSTDGSGDGLANKLASITATATSYTVGLGKSKSTYTSKKSDIGDQQDALTTKETAYKAQLTQTYSAMDTRVSSYKSIQNFLTNQIDAWNKSDS